MTVRVVIHSSRRWRQTFPFGFSGFIHGLLLGWLVWAAGIQALQPSPTLYDLAIKPYEKHLVWYNLRERLPKINSAEPAAEARKARARNRLNQTITAGKEDDARAPQKILMPAPAIELPKPLPLPNMLAVKEQSRIREFVPPVAAGHPSTPAPVLPEAPRFEARLTTKPVEIAASATKPVRSFVPPEEKLPSRQPAAPVVLPEAPRFTASVAAVTLPQVENIGPRRAFSVPASPAKPKPADPVGPSAPEVTLANPLSAALPRIPRGFMPPPQTKPNPRPETPVEAPPILTATPTPGAVATLAIVGLNPSKTMDIPPPPGSHEAAFSAGIKPESSKGDIAPDAAASITVPGLSTHGGSNENQPTTVSSLAGPNARQNLLAALHEAIPPSVAAPAAMIHATRVPSAPDGRLAGRYVYTLAIQMPNVTSYSGSWMVWFAERQPEPGETPGDVRPPVPVRKVDPKYIQSAVDERVEGTVRLAAIIRKTGQVESVELLQHLDTRLDQSAKEALGKWEFEPAQRNGVPIEVDAVFEIPFRLAPKPKR